MVDSSVRLGYVPKGQQVADILSSLRWDAGNCVASGGVVRIATSDEQTRSVFPGNQSA